MNLTPELVLARLRDGSAAEREAFLRELPASTFKDGALSLLGSDSHGMRIVVLAPVVQQYCYGSAPREGAVLAHALHEWAIEVCNTVPDHGLIPTTLSGLAANHLKALSLMASYERLLEISDAYIEVYAGEPENLPTLKTLQVEALVMLQRYEEAANALEDCKPLFDHPICGMELRRLRDRVAEVVKPAFELPKSEPGPQPEAHRSDMLGALGSLLNMAGLDGKGAVEGLAGNPSLDPTKPADFQALLGIIKQGEAILTKGQPDSEIAMASQIREASAIFPYSTPERAEILKSREKLVEALAWGEKHDAQQIRNDANWGLYLCASRLGEHDAAADAVIRLREGLETRRRGIPDPTKRAGVFGQYKYLFNVMCEQLHKAGRADDLLVAIESSKGRAIADRMTEKGTGVVADSAIYGCVSELPALAREYRFHYISYFVDDECVYAAFVDKTGNTHVGPAIALSTASIRAATAVVDPKRWGLLTPSRTPLPNAAEALGPLVGWLSEMVDRGVVEKDDHLVFCLDESLHNVPLSYIEFRDGILLDSFSLSTVHSAFTLHRVLSKPHRRPSDGFLGVVVPAVEDRDGEHADIMLKGFSAPVDWLTSHLSGPSVRNEEATIQRIAAENYANRIVHFSCHGLFQPDKNPFTHSYLLMASPNGLPLREATDDESGGLLSPKRIFDMGLDFEDSHVSTMACLSGLAREGVGGDALGLDWAFLDAGARSLVSTHWSVDVPASATVFASFYENWLDAKQSRATALRNAILKHLGKDRSPTAVRLWCGFSLTGDFR